MKKLIIGLSVLMPLAAVAGEVTDVGDTTLQALKMQREGRGAVENRPMLKDVADRTYVRYLDSFTHPIPPLFENKDSFNAGD